VANSCAAFYDIHMRVKQWFDETEDRTRAWLSRRPFLYGAVVGIGSVFFFRGIWMLADQISWMTGTLTFILALLILGMSGTITSHFISDRVIISGLKKEKKWEERLDIPDDSDQASAIRALRNEVKSLQGEIKKLRRDITGGK